ncbi:MAG TPA: hypothetical protein VIX91_00830 [Candidatus Acidoferrum sp.]
MKPTDTEDAVLASGLNSTRIPHTFRWAEPRVLSHRPPSFSLHKIVEAAGTIAQGYLEVYPIL